MLNCFTTKGVEKLRISAAVKLSVTLKRNDLAAPRSARRKRDPALGFSALNNNDNTNKTNNKLATYHAAG